MDPTSAGEVAERVAQQLLDALDEPFALLNDVLQVGASIGISLFPETAASAGELLLQADAAMYVAKRRQGRGSHVYRGAC